MDEERLSPLALAAVVLIVPGGTLIAGAVLWRRWRRGRAGKSVHPTGGRS